MGVLTVTVVFALYLITSAYMQPIAIYPSAQGCAVAASFLVGQLAEPPRPVLARPVCVPIPAAVSGGRSEAVDVAVDL